MPIFNSSFQYVQLGAAQYLGLRLTLFGKASNSGRIRLQCKFNEQIELNSNFGPHLFEGGRENQSESGLIPFVYRSMSLSHSKVKP